MPNIASVLKEEITRLARKELRANTDSLKKAVSTFRSEIAALKRRQQETERELARLRKAQGKVVRQEQPEEAATNLRFRPEGFAAKRKKLGWSAREVGLLLDASELSVYKWEQGKSRPRERHLQAIAALRKMGKREAQRRLEQLGAS